MQIGFRWSIFEKGVNIEFKKAIDMVQIGLRWGFDRGYTRFRQGFDKVLYKSKNVLTRLK